MNEEIKWSKKEVIERPTNYRIRSKPVVNIKVNVYRWKNYRLEKELYGDNRLSYHIAKDDRVRKLLTVAFPYENSEEQGIELYSIGETPLYLCDDFGSYNVCFYKNIKEATRTLQYILENGLLGRQEWVNPREEHVWGVLSYKPKETN